jgi:hypothetical protein
MPQIIPLQPVPSQTVQTLLNGQSCTINVYQKAFGVFFDLLVNDALLIGGRIAENLNVLVREAYLGFSGDLVFVDTQASPSLPASDPFYQGLGSRFQLQYLLPSELPPGLS